MYEMLELTSFHQIMLVRDSLQDRLDEIQEHMDNPNRPGKVMDNIARREIEELKVLLERLKHLVEKVK